MKLAFTTDTLPGSVWHTVRRGSFIGGYWPGLEPNDPLLNKWDNRRRALGRDWTMVALLDQRDYMVDSEYGKGSKYDRSRLELNITNRILGGHPWSGDLMTNTEYPIMYPALLGGTWEDDAYWNRKAARLLRTVHRDARQLSAAASLVEWNSPWITRTTAERNAESVVRFAHAYSNCTAWCVTVYPKRGELGAELEEQLDRARDLAGAANDRLRVNACITCRYDDDEYLGKDAFRDYAAAVVEIVQPDCLIFWEKAVENAGYPVVPEPYRDINQIGKEQIEVMGVMESLA